MTIVVPHTFDGLVGVTEQVAKHMDMLLGDSENLNDDINQDAVSAASRIQHAAQIVDAYLKENDEQAFVTTMSFSDTAWRTRISAKDLQDSITFLKKQDVESYQALNPWLAENESGIDLRDGMIALTQAALDVRAPLGKNELANALFDQTLDFASEYIGDTWRDEQNPAGLLAASCCAVLLGGDVPIAGIKSKLQETAVFVENAKDCTSSSCVETRVAKGFAVITGFAETIIQQAEARLPQPSAPVKPKQQPRKVFERYAGWVD